MAFLLILDREHKVLCVKTKNRSEHSRWLLPEVEDPVKKPSNLLNVELLAKQAFIPLKSSLIGKKNLLDISHNDQVIYLFLCPGKEASEILFDLTKYRDIQWTPINCIKETDNFSGLSGKSVIQTYHDILLNGFTVTKRNFHIVKNSHGKKETDDYNKAILQGKKRILIELKNQYSLYHQSIPQVGDYAFLNSWKGIPVAVLEITAVNIEPFEKINEVVRQMGSSEDLFSEDREKKYQKFFNSWCKNHNQKFSHSKEVVLSQFKIIRQFKESKMDHLRIP